MKTEYTYGLCKDKGGYSFRPKRPTSLDLNKIKKIMDSEVLIENPLLIVIKLNDEIGEVIIHKHGEIIFKDCEEDEKMKKIAEEIYDVSKNS